MLAAARVALQSTPKARFLSSASAIRFEKAGNARNVLKVESEDVPAVGANDVQVSMLAAPISRGDIQQVGGSYFSQTYPAVGGNEGVGIVTKIGSSVQGIAVNDRVIPAKEGLGTWRTELVADASAFQPISADIPTETAATLTAPAVAIRLLEDFVNLKEGDVIVQNAANGSIGLAVIQLAKARGIKTISILRTRPDGDDLACDMRALGADIVVTDFYAKTPEFARLISDLGTPVLGLNAAGGELGSLVANALGDSATFVTYGAMSGRPSLTLPSSAFLYKNLTLKGFSLTRWLDGASAQEKKELVDAASTAVTSGGVQLWLESRPFSDFPAAMKRATTKFCDRKVVLDFTS